MNTTTSRHARLGTLARASVRTALTALGLLAISQTHAGDRPWVPFEFCGTIVEMPYCGAVLAADDGTLLLLNDTGPFTIGDSVTVSGPITLACVSLPECTVGACIDVQRIKEATCASPADINGDGSVNALDLAILLAAWGTCAPLTIGCSGDINFDGLVNATDLSILLAGWTG
jgi:hypothetical protein